MLKRKCYKNLPYILKESCRFISSYQRKNKFHIFEITRKFSNRVFQEKFFISNEPKLNTIWKNWYLICCSFLRSRNYFNQSVGRKYQLYTHAHTLHFYFLLPDKIAIDARNTPFCIRRDFPVVSKLLKAITITLKKILFYRFGKNFTKFRYLKAVVIGSKNWC